MRKQERLLLKTLTYAHAYGYGRKRLRKMSKRHKGRLPARVVAGLYKQATSLWRNEKIDNVHKSGWIPQYVCFDELS